MESLRIDAVNIGLPGAGPRAFAHTEALAREIATHRMKIKPNCAARTHENDIRPIVEISQSAGIAIEAATFLGSSPIRRFVEDWTVDHLERTTENAVKFAVENGLPCMYVTEDTIRTDPGTVKRLYSTAISKRRAGRRSLRHRRPRNTEWCFQSGQIRDRRSRETIGRENSRRLARPQRSRPRHRQFACGRCCRCASGSCCRQCPRRARRQHAHGINARQPSPDGPYSTGPFSPQGVLRESRESHAHLDPAKLSVVGHDAFRTATGVHAAALIKAFRKNDLELANAVYSGVPAHLFGLDQVMRSAR